MKKITNMTDEELKELRYNKSVVGTTQECLIVGVRSEDGEVIAIPISEVERQKARDEATAIAIQMYRKSTQ